MKGEPAQQDRPGDPADPAAQDKWTKVSPRCDPMPAKAPALPFAALFECARERTVGN